MKSVREMLKGSDELLADEETVIITGEGSVVGCGWATTIQAVLSVTAIPAGYSDETLDVTIVNYDPKTGEEDDLITFTQVTSSTGDEWKYEDTNKRIGNHIKAKWAITGTSPDYDFKIVAHLKKQ